MEGDDDEGLRRGGGKKGKESRKKKKDEAEAYYMHHRCQLDLGFNISISVRETEERQGIEKHNLRHAFHFGFLWSPSAFRHEGRRRGEGEKAAKEGIRSSFDCFSPSFFGCSSTPLQHGIHRVTSEPVTWHCTGVTGMKPVQSQRQVSYQCHHPEVSGGRGGSSRTASTGAEQHANCSGGRSFYSFYSKSQFDSSLKLVWSATLG